MIWSEIPWQPAPRLLRQFALLCLLVFGGLAFIQYHREHVLAAAVLGAIGLALAVMGLARPHWLGPVYVGCMVLAFPIGWLVLNLCLAAIYFGMITPLACWFRLAGRDPLERRLDPNRESYLQPKPEPPVANYYRTY